ncbi:hypothetical protein [Actinoplanes couchii]|uniref:Uncharacterized protein n=1 Tax=Actinoplanes couchii TaxID=403638 RepID=A0ABQ3XRW8_9ACTN|nr:hypothetical protein [Actinoplanes couchii]MDR6318448.1 hypothetical protein [Actinoplanes couchii]GID61205.1 hypothetical protein Aco03nite_096090 [Actinoplanes couchii]
MIREDGTHHGHLNEPGNPAAIRSITRIADWIGSVAFSATCREAQRPTHPAREPETRCTLDRVRPQKSKKQPDPLVS